MLEQDSMPKTLRSCRLPLCYLLCRSNWSDMYVFSSRWTSALLTKPEPRWCQFTYETAAVAVASALWSTGDAKAGAKGLDGGAFNW